MSSQPGEVQSTVISASVRKNLRFNYLVNVGDGTFFGLALGITSFTAVLPLFVASFTNSAILIGLIPSLHSLGWQLPQLFTARFTSSLKRLKPVLLAFSIFERLPFLALAFLAFFSSRLSASTVLLLSFSLLIFQGFMGGLAANPWQNMLAKVIPGEIRGTFFGVVNGSSNMMASLGALLSGFLLEKTFFPNNFAICFLLSFILYLISYTCLGLTREPARQVNEIQPQTLANQKTLIRQILKKDRRFTAFLITRFLYQFGMMALAYYTVFTAKVLQISTLTIGALTATLLIVQVISNPVLGWLSDRWGKRNAFLSGAISAGISAFLAALAQEDWIFFLVFLFMGIANSAYWTIGIAYSLEFGDETEKPTYVGLSNTLVSPSILIAPLMGGWLANMGGYRLTFWISCFFALLTALILVLFERNSGIKEEYPVT